MAEQDSRNSLRHILVDEPVVETPMPARQVSPPPQAPPSYDDPAETSTVHTGDGGDDDRPKDADTPQYTSTTQTTRRNANGSVSSVYSGNKIKHLKKEDGVPLWRKDIQYEFLKLVFEDETKAFTQYSDRTTGHTFAEIYIDAMAKSSKTSKILKEKLAQDHASAVSMAMVCLLVNVGRMNTTLNFFPEMRAQLRTYHSIPALQAHQDPNAYKQLQDAPRLKSILKGASEDDPQPGTIEEIKTAAVPRTNPVNLIFVLAQYAPKISEVHFTPPRDFFDLVMRPTLSSKSRATAFLWLLWWYLESNFSYEDALRNPFGPGQDGEGTGGLPVKVPTFEVLTEEQAVLENQDTEEETAFGEMKRRERIGIVASEPSPAMTALKRARKERSLASGFAYVASDNEGTMTPSREYQSPVPQGSAYSNTVRDYQSSEHTRSPSLPATSGFQAVNLAPKPPQPAPAPAPMPVSAPAAMNISNMLSSDQSPAQATPHAAVPIPAAVTSAEKKKGPGRGNWRRNKDKVPVHHEIHPLLPTPAQFTFIHGSSPVPHTPGFASTTTAFPTVTPISFNTITNAPPVLAPAPSSSSGGAIANNMVSHVPTPSYQSSKRTRPQTQHQVAISEYRRGRISLILDRGIRSQQARAYKTRKSEGTILRAWKRIRMLPSGWDSDEEEAKLAKEVEKNGESEANGAGASNAKGKDISEGALLKQREAKRPIGGVWMAGFVLPHLREVEDMGEYGLRMGSTFRRVGRREHRMETQRYAEVKIDRFVKSRKAPKVLPGDEEGAFMGLGLGTLTELGERPRLSRKSGGAAGVGGKSRSRKSGAGAGKRRVGGDVKVVETREGGEATPGGGAEVVDEEEVDEMDVDADEDGEGGDDVAMEDGEADGEAEDGAEPAELDQEDRDLLGEVDADESEEEEEEEEEEEDEEEDNETPRPPEVRPGISALTHPKVGA